MKFLKPFGVALLSLVLILGVVTPANAAPKQYGATVNLTYIVSQDYTKLTSKVVPIKLYGGYEGTSSIAWDTVQYSVTVEKRLGTKGEWTLVDTPVILGDWGFETTVPAVTMTAKSQKIYYRFVSAPNDTVLNLSTSKPILVTYENQAKYTGFKKSLWKSVKKYCPTAVVRVKDLSGKRAGLYRGGSHILYVDKAVKKYSSANQKAVILHECAHLRQSMDFATNSKLNKTLKKYFKAPKGVSLVEHSADCASIGMNPKGYMGYGGTCTKAERKVGKKLLLGTLA